MAYIEFQNVFKTYGSDESAVNALDGVSFSMERGEIVAVLGNSGSGKTTALNLLGGLDSASSGRVRVGEAELSELSGRELTEYRRRRVGYVFQLYNLIGCLTALENVEVARRLGPGNVDSTVALADVGLADQAKQFPSQLSGGQMQRVAIARALSKEPELLLCDEPTGALDSATGQEVLELLASQAVQDERTVVIVTHNPVIAQIANRVLLLRDGKVVSEELNPAPARAQDIAL
ncbi:MAG: ABC transporter ATP-binding protein [Bifidobacteriaceae bacterium]|jgi:putative ABC transport system ATP-binding protein|nr:ABC transporter ATP-binding protein [Bifidobacteriaceae bacterium]